MKTSISPSVPKVPAYRAILAVVLSVNLLIGPTAVYSQPDPPLIIGVFPRRNAALTMHLFTPLARYLEDQLGRPVKLRTSANFYTFLRSLNPRRFDLVHLNQYQYIRAHDAYGYEAIAQNEEFGESSIKSALFVRKGSGIESLSQLQGRRIIFGGDRTAMMSYILPTFLLREAGLEAGDYQELFAVNPPNAMIATHLGQADACGVGQIVIRLPMVARKFDTSELRAVATSEPFSHLPWAVSAQMPEPLKRRLQTLLLGLENTAEGRRILETAHLTGLNPANDADYDSHRAIVRRVLGKDE